MGVIGLRMAQHVVQVFCNRMRGWQRIVGNAFARKAGDDLIVAGVLLIVSPFLHPSLCAFVGYHFLACKMHFIFDKLEQHVHSHELGVNVQVQ